MKVLRQINPIKFSILNQQKIENNINYVKNPYLIYDDNNINLLFNPITEQAIFVNSFEQDKDELIKKWYLIPENFDLKTMTYLIRQKRLQQLQNIKTKNTYTIFTTTACNGNCQYCFEKNYKIITMTKEIAEKIIAYIIKNANLQKPIKLNWFGGEPLVNKQIINFICKKLSEYEINFLSNLTTNGDLLETCSNDELKSWNLKWVQLTLDDINERYEKIKVLPSGAYQKLHESINRLQKLGITINIRIHYHPQIGANACYRIINDLKKYNNINFYIRIIYGKENLNDYLKVLEIENYLIKIKKAKVNFPSYSKGYYCMADNNNYTTITPLGQLSPCQHQVYGKHMYGTIFSNDINNNIKNNWKTKIKNQNDFCKKCKLYPLCEKITLCPASGKCEKGYSYYQIEKIKRAMRMKYNNIRG